MYPRRLNAMSVDLNNDLLSTQSFEQSTEFCKGSLEISIRSHEHVETDLATPPAELVTEAFLSTSGQWDLPPVSTFEDPLVAVIGVGYVGLELVQTFSKFYNVIAFDVSEKRLKTIESQLKKYPSVTPTTDPGNLSRATHFLVAVPTLLLPDRRIDNTYLHDALNNVAFYARPGATLVIESSVSVGMTRQLLEPLMRSRGLMAGMSPERVDPGRISPSIEEIPKIISGLDDITKGSLDSINALYSKPFHKIVKVSCPEVAEMTKLYENCQRMVCIAYANEMADACVALQIDPHEVYEASKSKPFGFMPYTSGLGVGGHCIPVNPYYLFATTDEFTILRAATEKMSQRPAMVGDRIMSDLKQRDEQKFYRQRQKVLVVGAAFKRGQSVTSYSPSIALINHLLDKWNAHVTFADPLVNADAIPYVPRLDETKEWSRDGLEQFDVIIVAMEQEGLDYDVLATLQGVLVHRC